MRAAFAAAHRARFGFDPGEAPLVIEAAGAEAVGRRGRRGGAGGRGGRRPSPRRRWWRRSGSAAAGVEARFVRREAMAPGTRLAGPAVLVEPHTVDPGRAGVARRGSPAHDHVELRRVVPRPGREAVGTRADPVMLEVFNNLYMSIAEQMGAVLENTAVSVTIKERLDFSCAVFDASGRPDRQRAAHAGASRLDGGERQGDHRAEPGDGAGGRLRAERALQRRHASARHHGGAAGLGRGRRRGCCSSPRRAGTIPTSAG